MWLKKAFILVTLLALTYGCHSSANGDLQKRSFRFEDEESADKITTHSELKFQKKSIFKSTKSNFLTFSKVEKHIFCYFKNGIKSIFAPEKSSKLPKIKNAIFGLEKNKNFFG